MLFVAGAVRFVLSSLLLKPKRKRVSGGVFEASSASAGQTSRRASMLASAARRATTAAVQNVVGDVYENADGLLMSSNYIDLGSCTEKCKGGPVNGLHLRMAAAVEENLIACLTNGGDTPPLKIRVLRRWNPPFRNTQTCFIFIDKEGTPVQANVKTTEQRMVEGRIRLGSCYIMTRYGCGDVDDYSNILHHSTHLVIGSTTQFTPIADAEEIPRYYFDFASRDRMEFVCDRGNETIDYIVILDDVKEKITIGKKPYLFMTARDCSNKLLNLILWDEIANSLERYDRPAIQSAAKPRIVAFTAMKVKMFSQGPRLQSTTATYVYLNPTSVHTHTLQDLYASGVPAEKSLILQMNTPNNASQIMVSIQDILSKTSAELTNKNFVVTGELCHITNKGWCYIACPLCGKSLTRVLKRWFCPKDDIIDEPLYSYRLTGVISDGTGSVDVTLFNDAVVQLIELPCDNIIQSNPTIDMHKLPSVIQDSVGTEARFHLQAYRNERNGSTRCTVNRVELLNIRPNAVIQQQRPSAPVTPQQQLTVPPHQTSSSAKRQLTLHDAETSNSTKISKTTADAAGKEKVEGSQSQLFTTINPGKTTATSTSTAKNNA
ncbi:hypothetical protein QVD17_31567 [Tagetes erecta]|uniref:Replication factor A C-terminal domain-containing protein n=1 Tax=Tagetes erecta TaxID=13708 RepID=A0AAD8KA24_TARER|nr:hypothetical protein QVD17_31567 [Tagetes erecta]